MQFSSRLLLSSLWSAWAVLNFFCTATARTCRSLIKAGLAHVQFETIHPFLDGTDDLGRLLITYLLCLTMRSANRSYTSAVPKTHRAAYYELLERVRAKGEWEIWLDFFLTGVKETADQAAEAARRIVALFDEHQKKIERLGRPAASVLRVSSTATKPMYRSRPPLKR